MAKKNTADVLINGKIYTISGYESTAYLQKVATYLNEMEEKVAVTEAISLSGLVSNRPRPLLLPSRPSTKTAKILPSKSKAATTRSSLHAPLLSWNA